MNEKNEIMKERLKKLNQEVYYNSKDKLKKESKEKLSKEVQKKLTTIMIGALDKYETFMGHKWGHGLNEDDCSDEQLDTYDIWQQCRHEIMDLGNKQIRAILSELDLYEIEWKGYKRLYKKD